MSIKINAKELIYFQIFLVLFEGILIDVFKFPSAIKYLTDILTLLIFLLSFKRINRTIPKLKMNILLGIIGIYFIYSIFSITIGMSGLFLSFWGMRNIFRFYLFYLSCIATLDNDDFKKAIINLKKVYVLNFLLVLVQYFIFHYKMDYLGGIFGITKGCNGSLNLFIIIMLCIVFVEYLNNKSNITNLGLYIVSSFIIAGLAELKVIYFEIVVMAIVLLFIKKPSFRTLLIGVGLFGGMVIGLKVMENIFPDAYKVIADWRNIDIYLSSSWFGQIEITRMTAFDIITNKFFDNKFYIILIGLGLGSCEETSFKISQFAQNYGYMNYKRYSFAMKYLETGAIGLLLFVMIFLIILIFALKNRKKNNKSIYAQTIILLIPFVFLNIWYNESCTLEIAYLLYFILSVVGIERKEYFLR